MNGNHQVFAYADDVNLIVDDFRTVGRNADVLLNACKDIGLAINTGKAKYMELGHHRGMISNEHIRIGSNSYGEVKSYICIFRLFSDKSKFYSEGKQNLDLKQEIHVIIQSKHLCLLDFSLRI
jgi:hypothetical protein